MLFLFNILCFDLSIRSLNLSTFKESLLAFNKSEINFRSQFKLFKKMDFNLLLSQRMHVSSAEATN